MRGTRTGARRVVACVVAALLAAGLLPAAPQAAALAEGPGEIQVLGSEPALGDAIELVGDEVVTTGGSGGDTLESVGPEGDGPDVAVQGSGGDGPAAGTQAVGVGVSNPRVVEDSSMTSGQVATWDCVWFGSYPQTEVTPDDPLYEALRSADWDESGDAVVGGERYRRISKSDATYSGWWSDDGYGSAACRYFRYEPVKWRVLEVYGATALVVADVALDCQRYNANNAGVTWETSGIRSWLNGYGADSNQPGTDFGGRGFIDVAFSPDERGAILQSRVANANNTEYYTAGGNDTDDGAFLLSEAEAYGSGGASHGFAGSYVTRDEARRCKPSDYARAMGAWRSSDSGSVGNCYWWLRSPGYSASHAAYVDYDGYVCRYGDYVNYGHTAVRPALNIDLTSSNLLVAGTVGSDGGVAELAPITSVVLDASSYAYDGKAKRPAVTVTSRGAAVPEAGYDVLYEGDVEVGTATVTVTGRGGYVGTKRVTFTITPATVDRVEVELAAPVTGDALAAAASTATAGVALGDVSWSPQETTAVYRTAYTATVIAAADKNHAFAEGVTATVNGRAATVSTHADGTLSVSYAFGETPLNTVEIGTSDARATYSADGVAVPVGAMFSLPAGAGAATYSVGAAGDTGKGAYDAKAGRLSVKRCGTFTVRVSTAETATHEAASASATLTVGRAPITSVSKPAKRTYTGKPRTQAPTVKAGGRTLKEGTDYKLSYKDNKKAGTATMTVTGVGNYKGSVKKTFKIVKAANPMKVRAVKRTAKASKARKKAQAVARPIKFTKKAKGTVTYKKAGGSKLLSVSKKTGKVTVRKGTKAGTYKIRIKVAAAGNANYKKASKTVTCTVVVK